MAHKGRVKLNVFVRSLLSIESPVGKLIPQELGDALWQVIGFDDAMDPDGGGAAVVGA